MTHAEIRHELAKRIERLLETDPDNLPVTLHTHQRETFERMLAWLRDPDGSKAGYIEHPTGLGKTIIFACLAAFCAGLRTLIVVPSKVLIEQTARALIPFTGGIIGHLSSLDDIRDDRGTILAIKGHEYTDIVITTDETFSRNPALIQQTFGPHLIVWDECHWAFSGINAAACEHFRESVVIGFSATPDYLVPVVKDEYATVALENGTMLFAEADRVAKRRFPTCIDRRGVRWAIENGWLAPLAWGMLDFDFSLDPVPVRPGLAGMDYASESLSAYLTAHWSDMTRSVMKLYESGDYSLADHQAFAICPSVALAEELTDGIASVGIPATCVSGKNTARERNTRLRA